ncbi:MAG: hypothetical protein E6Q74_03125, partial [Pseudoxanthomonas sp.]
RAARSAACRSASAARSCRPRAAASAAARLAASAPAAAAAAGRGGGGGGGGGGAGISSGGGGGSSWTIRFEQPASTRAASNRQSIRRIDHPIERRHGRPRPPGRPAR